jgi:hypothetical protein
MTVSLERTIAELKARQDIHDVLVRYCRGADLCDAELMRSCYHDDAVDDHGFFNGPADEFVVGAVGNLGTLFESTRHIMTNEYVELSGDVAAVETYILCQLRLTRDDGKYDVTARCRYLDRFESRDGVWRIAHRKLISDGPRVDKVGEEYPRLDPGAPGARGSNDPSSGHFTRVEQRQPAAELS